MSHRLSQRRALLAAPAALLATASTLTAATLLVAPAAHAAGPPVITGVSTPWVYNVGRDDTVTISGSGFTGATRVSIAGSVSSVRDFAVNSDHTITVTIAGDSSGAVLFGSFSVTVGDQTSAPTPLAKVGFGVAPPTNTVSTALQCSLGAETFAAQLSSNFVYDGSYPRIVVPDSTGTLYIPEPFKPRVGSAVLLGEFRTSLVVDGSVSAGPLAKLSGTGTVTAIETDVTGAVESSLDLAAATRPAAAFPLPSSVDGNPLAFGSGNLASTTFHTLPTDSRVTIALKAYRAQVGLATGGTASLDCTPSNTANRALASFSPLPRVDSTPTPTPSPTATPTPSPTPTPTPTEPTARFNYVLQGSTTLNTLTKGSMPLTGGVAASLGLATGTVTADLRLNDTQGRLTALGFLPVTATVGFVSSGQTTGKLVDDQLTTTSKVRIKVKSVKAFGAIPLAGGNDCQSKSLSTINLASTDSFDPTVTGGTLAGTYAISDLNGCGPLGGLISPLTSGAGNTISVKLRPVA